MENLLSVVFEAHHAGNNHHRRYEIRVGTDLLNDWTVSILYGRTGQGGHELHYAGANKSELRAIIRERLQRRLSAPKRIGCPYRLTSLNAAPGFDIANWLPRNAIAEFIS